MINGTRSRNALPSPSIDMDGRGLHGNMRRNLTVAGHTSNLACWKARGVVGRHLKGKKNFRVVASLRALVRA